MLKRKNGVGSSMISTGIVGTPFQSYSPNRANKILQKTLAPAGAPGSSRAVTSRNVNMHPDFQHGPRPRHPDLETVRLRLRRVLPRGGGARPRLAAHPGVRGVGLAAGVGGGIRLHARRRAVRP